MPGDDLRHVARRGGRLIQGSAADARLWVELLYSISLLPKWSLTMLKVCDLDGRAHD